MTVKCDLCGGHYRERPIVLSFQRQGRTVAVENVPARVCDRCGDEVLSEATAREIEKLLEQEPQSTAPLYRFPEKVTHTG